MTTRTTPIAIEDLPYTEGDDDVTGGEEQPTLSPVVDLTDRRHTGPGPDDGDDWLTAFEDAHPT